MLVRELATEWLVRKDFADFGWQIVLLLPPHIDKR
jgi:hypothetical protein